MGSWFSDKARISTKSNLRVLAGTSAASQMSRCLRHASPCVCQIFKRLHALYRASQTSSTLIQPFANASPVSHCPLLRGLRGFVQFPRISFDRARPNRFQPISTSLATDFNRWTLPRQEGRRHLHRPQGDGRRPRATCGVSLNCPREGLEGFVLPVLPYRPTDHPTTRPSDDATILRCNDPANQPPNHPTT